MNTIFTRVSIRKFQDRPVEPEKLEKLLRAAMAAPSAKNHQPWEFYVVKNRDIIERLSEVGSLPSVPEMLLSSSYPAGR